MAKCEALTGSVVKGLSDSHCCAVILLPNQFAVLDDDSYNSSYC